MERKLMIAPSMGCCDLFDMERQDLKTKAVLLRSRVWNEN